MPSNVKSRVKPEKRQVSFVDVVVADSDTSSEKWNSSLLLSSVLTNFPSADIHMPLDLGQENKTENNSNNNPQKQTNKSKPKAVHY